MMGIAIAASMTGCTRRVWFTQPMREAFELGLHEGTVAGEAANGRDNTGHAPDELQYFSSERIVLMRDVTARRSQLSRGRIVQRRGRYFERIIVRRGTPAVAVDWGPDWVAVSFEEGTRLHFDLVHAARSEQPGDDREPAGFFGEAFPSTYYQLRTVKAPDGSDAVEFDGQLYAPDGASAQARLEVRRSDWTNYHRARRVLRGRRID